MFQIVLQARMNSSRLPGMIVADVEGVSLLGRSPERLRATQQHLGEEVVVVVDTSTTSSDDETERLCNNMCVPCVRGPEDDVLMRYLVAVRDMHDDDVVLRATADNCLYCPKRSAEIIRIHRQNDCDYTSIKNLSYVVPEVIRVGAFRSMALLAKTSYCREHVPPLFSRRAE